MKNKEKFAKEIIEIACTGDILAMSGETLRGCKGLQCKNCFFHDEYIRCNENRIKWAESEYVEYETDWSKVPVDTPVLLKGVASNRRYFSRLLPDGRISTFSNGRTSWSAQGTAPEISCSKSDVVLAREGDKLKYRKQVE